MKQDHDETAEGLGPDAAVFLDSVRGLDEPTASDRHRVRRRVLAAVAATGAASAAGGTATAAAATGGASAGAAAVGGTLTAKVWIGIAVGLVSAGVAGGVATMSSKPEDTPRVAATVPDSTRESEPGSPASGSELGSSESASELGSSASASESELGSSESESAPVLGQVVPRPRAAEPPVAEPAPAPERRAAEAEAPEPTSPETLAEELALIRRAHAAANVGNHMEALRILSEHAQRFPNGSLATERQGARASALCQAGRLAEGRAAAERFLAAHPSSPLRGRVSRSCAE